MHASNTQYKYICQIHKQVEFKIYINKSLEIAIRFEDSENSLLGALIYKQRHNNRVSFTKLS